MLRPSGEIAQCGARAPFGGPAAPPPSGALRLYGARVCSSPVPAPCGGIAPYGAPRPAKVSARSGERAPSGVAVFSLVARISTSLSTARTNMTGTARLYIAFIANLGLVILIGGISQWQCTNPAQFLCYLGLAVFASTRKVR